ncbi:MAG: hypothetical protein E7049_13390 [Lentisphaerae bacterium]|nr:hypothetical protein [Lentisphaerota bacterium]
MNIRTVHIAAAAAALLSSQACAITVEVAPGEPECVRRAAAGLRADLDRACPGHGADTRRIVARTVPDGRWEASVRTYSNGVWTVTGSDARGTVFGLYAISEELGVNAFHWLDDVPVEPREFALPEECFEIAPPGVKYRGLFINDEDWGLMPWAKENFEADGSKSIGAKTYEKLFEAMLRLRLNLIWPAMHPWGYEFVSREENMALASAMGIVVGASHCEPMLRNNVYWDRKTQGEWNYATNREKIDEYWRWSAEKYGRCEALWTIGIRGTHDEPMKGGNDMEAKKALMYEVFATQTNLLAKYVAPHHDAPPATTFIPYKEVLPIYDSGLEVPAGASIMWVDDNFGYIRRLGGSAAASHPGGIYWHVSYFGGPHSYTHVCTTAPGFMWYELAAKCAANNAREVWMVNVGDFKPADIAIDAFARFAWTPEKFGPDAQREFLDGWAQRFLGPSNAALASRIAAHLAEYYRLGTIRKPELMCWQWITKLTDAEKKSLMAQYAALAAEDIAIEAELAKQWKDPWFETVGFQVRFLAEAGMAFMSDDILEEGAKDRLKPRFAALNERYETVFGGKWRRFWFDTIDEKEWWCQGGNNWASQMQWPWKEPGDRRKWHSATAGGDGIGEKDWKDAADFIRKSPANGGSWECVAGLGISARAMALLPVVEGAGKGAWMEYEIEGKGEMATGNGELVLQFLPDYRLYPGMKLCVEVSVNGSEWQCVEVPFSDGTKDENSPGRYTAVQDNFVRAFVKCPSLKEDINTIRIRAVDPGAVLDRVAVRK